MKPEQPTQGKDDERSTSTEKCDAAAGCCPPVDRRTFIKWTGAGAAALAGTSARQNAIAGPFQSGDVKDHFVPADKKLKSDWLETLFAQGESTWYDGQDLETIAMPVGGICTGQLYLTGDGRLVHWDIFNQHIFTGYGRENYELDRVSSSPLAQGFAIHVRSGGHSVQRTLDASGFPGVRFCGEYPIGTVEYGDESVPVKVKLEAFSPFIPLNEVDSALPATVLEFTVENIATETAEVTLAGWLENAVCLHSSQSLHGLRSNRVVKRDGLTAIQGTARSADAPANAREPIVLSDFEDGSYGDWTVKGEAFGQRPAQGTLDRQQEVSGFLGRGLVNTYLGGNDQLRGKLISPSFKIERFFICFLIGGGGHEGKTCMNLIVDGQVVRTAAGRNKEPLTWRTWDVRQFAGKSAHIEIVDDDSDAWGHINIDQIELRDQPVPAVQGELEDQPDFGSMALAVLDSGPGVLVCPSLPEGAPGEVLFAGDVLAASETPKERPFGQMLCGAVGKQVHLGPGEKCKITFAVTWFFPTHEVRGQQRGNFYANRFEDAASVAAYLADQYDRLAGQTRMWHKT